MTPLFVLSYAPCHFARHLHAERVVGMRNGVAHIVFATEEPGVVDSNGAAMNILYKASVTSTGGRDGGVKSDDGIIDMQLALPPGLGGPGGKTNPEQLFAAGYAACFHSALKRVAAAHKASIGDSKVTAEVGIGPNDVGGFALEVHLFVELPRTAPGVAEAVVKDAHKLCPYSIATRGNIDVHINVKAEDGAELALA